MSVLIVDVKERTSHDGSPFMAFIVQNELELVKSKSGNIYATAHKASIPCTLDCDTAKMMVGKELPGTLEKVACEPFEHVTENGEMVQLDHRWQYVPETNRAEIQEKEELAVFEVADPV